MIELSHAQTLAEVDHGRSGPEIAAYFDLDGTLVAGFTAAAFIQHRLRQGELDANVVAETLRLGLEGILGRIHFEEFPLRSWTHFATASVDGIERRMWTWSPTPPTTIAFILFSRAMPPR